MFIYLNLTQYALFADTPNQSFTFRWGKKILSYFRKSNLVNKCGNLPLFTLLINDFKVLQV